MRLPAIVAQLLPRIQRLGLIDATGMYDESEVLAYMENAVRFLASKYQVPMFLVLDRELLRTVNGTDSYLLPGDMSLYIPTSTYISGVLPRQPSGLVLTNVDGSGLVSLRYEDPPEFLTRSQLTATTSGPPQFYTVTGHTLYLFPIPDAVYKVQAVTRSTQDGIEDVPGEAVACVSVETLWRMAADRGIASAVLSQERMDLTSALVNDAARLKWAAAKHRAERDVGKYWFSSR